MSMCACQHSMHVSRECGGVEKFLLARNHRIQVRVGHFTHVHVVCVIIETDVLGIYTSSLFKINYLFLFYCILLFFFSFKKSYCQVCS